MSADAMRNGANRDATSLEYLRKRSLRKVWWSSARIALERDKLRRPRLTPNDPLSGHGKRV